MIRCDQDGDVWTVTIDRPDKAGALTREMLTELADIAEAANAADDVKAELVGYLSKNKEISAAEFRDLIGASRKQAVPLLEYFDARAVTVRDGDVRRLKEGS